MSIILKIYHNLDTNYDPQDTNPLLQFNRVTCDHLDDMIWTCSGDVITVQYVPLFVNHVDSNTIIQSFIINYC